MPVSASGRGRACGKLILFGEHAVVFGVPALVAGIASGVEAEARAEGEGQHLRLLDFHTDAAGDDEHARAFRALLEAGGAPPALQVQVGGPLPAGVGMGFSAAAAVAMGRAVESLAGRDDPARVEARAMAWERVYHGNPSGVDVAAAMRGGCCRFVRREAGNRVERLAMGAPLTLAVGLTGTRSSTKAMVAGVARRREADPVAFDEELEAIGALSEHAARALAAGDGPALGELMDANQEMLSKWMLSTTALEKLCATAREAGAWGAKLTGAGGGGAMVALVEDRTVGDAVVAAWQDRGYEGFVTQIGETP